jgi:Spy/CpxP family protein refolding chaperone
MKATVLGIVLALAGACVLAQTPTPNSSATPPPPMHRMHHDMMAAHMQQMRDQVSKMRSTLEEMKANLSKITDPALKQQAQYDVDLWEAMVHHMEVMTDMMGSHSGMGMGHGMGMGSGNGMGGMQPSNSAPEKPAQPQK